MPDLNNITDWISQLTPDKLALLVPLAAAYAIIRTRAINSNWCWIVCPVLAAVIFGIIGPSDATKTVLQNRTVRGCVGLLLGFVSCLVALGLHGWAFKALADKFPLLKFLVLADEPAATNNNEPTNKP